MNFNTVFVAENANYEKNSQPQYSHSYLLFAQPIVNILKIRRDSFVSIMVQYIPLFFVILTQYLRREMPIVKKKSQPQLSVMVGCRLLCCYFLSLLLIIKKCKEAVLLSSWYISLVFIFVIFNKVLVLEYVIF